MDNVPWGQFSVATGGWLLVGGFVFAILRGRLVPRSSLDDAIHDRNNWMAESRIKDVQISTKDEQIATKDRQLDHLAEVGEIQKSILRSLGRNDPQEQG